MRFKPSFFNAKTAAPCAVLILLVLGGCGQRGPLYLPTDPEAKERASLPESLLPSPPASTTDNPTTAN